MEKRELSFLILAGLFMAVMTFISLISGKLVTMFGLTTTAGSFFYILLYSLGDLINECFGRKKALQVVYVGFLVGIITSIFAIIAVALPPADVWRGNQIFFASFFGQVPRIVIGGLVAYLVAQYIDVYIFHITRLKTRNKIFLFRLNTSILFSQIFDSAVFLTIAFAGVIPFSVLVTAFIGHYVVKVVMNWADTPFVYLGRHIIGVPEEIKKEYEAGS